MNKTTKMMIAAGILGVMSAGAAQAEDAAKPEMQKCYGVAKAGKNDCSGGAVASCAGSSKKDGEGFINLPKGACERLVGGKLSA